jgi:hypothetical protein
MDAINSNDVSNISGTSNSNYGINNWDASISRNNSSNSKGASSSRIASKSACNNNSPATARLL